MSDLLAGAYETDSGRLEKWQQAISDRLDALESSAAPKANFDINAWHTIGRFNQLFAKDFSVELSSTGDAVSINDAGIQIDTRDSSGDARAVRWYYNDGSGPSSVGSLYGAYGIAENASFMRVDARRHAGDTPTKAILMLEAHNLEAGETAGIALTSSDGASRNRIDLYGDVYLNGTLVSSY